MQSSPPLGDKGTFFLPISNPQLIAVAFVHLILKGEWGISYHWTIQRGKNAVQDGEERKGRNREKRGKRSVKKIKKDNEGKIKEKKRKARRQRKEHKKI